MTTRAIRSFGSQVLRVTLVGVLLTCTEVLGHNSNPLTGHVVTWASDNAAVATVSGSGLVRGVGAGSVTITASSDGKDGTAAITVTPAPVASVVVNPATANVPEGGTIQLTATPKDAAGNCLTGRVVTWSSGEETLATVDATGRVTAVAVGLVTITATSEGKSGTADVTVTVPVASVDVTPAPANIELGATVQLTAVPRDASGNPLLERTVTWASSDPAVATVNETGLVTGVGVGSVAITATSEGSGGSSVITVICSGSWPAALYPRMPLSTGQAFYVAPSGSDLNPGTFTAPWQTLQKAFTALQPGQIAYLRDGSYGQFCTISTFSRAGTALAPITVQGYPGEQAVLHGQISLRGSYFRLSNVIVEGPTCGAWGASSRQGDNMILLVPGSSHHIEVSSSEVYHSGWHAGISAGGDDIYILSNYIHDNGGFNDPGQLNTSHGIYYHDGTRGVIANNILEHNRAKGISARYAGNNIFVVNNAVVGNGRSGIDITENTHDWTLANNIIMNNGNVNGGSGINTTGTTGGASMLELNNIFWNNGTTGLSNWVANVTVVNNRVSDPLLVNPVNSVPSTDHVGYTNDYHLRPGSPAIDFGSATYAPTLAFGPACRPLGAGFDAGVYER